MKGSMLVMNKLRIVSAAVITVAVAAGLSSCGNKKNPGLEFARNMYDPIAFNPDQPNDNFANGQTAQLPPEGTMPVGYDPVADAYPNTPEGYQAASANLKNPLPATQQNLSQGRTLYLHMCSHCHGTQGHGDGQIIKLEKFPPPPSYSTGNSSRGGAMKDLTDGKIFHTITYGLNLMGPHRTQLNPTERWKIVMYVHELQKLQ
ncbi:cytochrome C [Pararcticibacter amylolyticus]|uniref:Cytochrome C n=2 Tax=Pararcticibacter amylolyticus TaxID=2173175 RepID=A0A2U2PBP6_9SPHI|nr:cytochrome C [Pararcticibacter amylolyticus]